jgi:hypothetical protein
MKTLDEEWKFFLKLSYIKERLTPHQELCLKRAFYSGLLTALTSCMEASRSKSEKQAEQKVGAILKECLETCAVLAEFDSSKLENN